MSFHTAQPAITAPPTSGLNPTQLDPRLNIKATTITTPSNPTTSTPTAHHQLSPRAVQASSNSPNPSPPDKKRPRASAAPSRYIRTPRATKTTTPSSLCRRRHRPDLKGPRIAWVAFSWSSMMSASTAQTSTWRTYRTDRIPRSAAALLRAVSGPGPSTDLEFRSPANDGYGPCSGSVMHKTPRWAAKSDGTSTRRGDGPVVANAATTASAAALQGRPTQSKRMAFVANTTWQLPQDETTEEVRRRTQQLVHER